MSDLANKLEKIAAAIYFISSFFDDREPSKWKLRSLSVGLVSEEIKDKAYVVKEISTLLMLAKNAGLVSDTNHDILSKEILKIGDVKTSLGSFFHQDSPRTSVAISAPQRTEYLKPNIIDKKAEDKPTLKEFGVISVKKNSRQSIIINILKRKKEIMIKDVTPLINGCSEKTIQRELSSMVEKGLLKKTGEKRWSRYSLAQP